MKKSLARRLIESVQSLTEETWNQGKLAKEDGEVTRRCATGQIALDLFGWEPNVLLVTNTSEVISALTEEFGGLRGLRDYHIDRIVSLNDGAEYLGQAQDNIVMYLEDIAE